MESLPPEKRIAGLSNCAAVSRMIKIASSSRSLGKIFKYSLILIVILFLYLFRLVQSALFLCFFPPPAAGPYILAGLNGPGARRAANAGETPLVQAVYGDPVGSDKRLHVFIRPIEYRVVFHDLEIVVPLHCFK